MPRVVKVGAGAFGAQARADQHQGVLPQFAGFDGGGQVGQHAVHDQLVRPGHLVGDHAWGVRGVAAAQQLLLQLARPRGGQEQRHRGAVPGEAGDLLPGRHRGLAAAEPGEDHRLGHLGNGQFPADRGGGRGEAGHARHDLGGQPQRGALVQLLLDRAPQGRVAGVHPRHLQAVAGGTFVVRQHALHRQLRGVHYLRPRSRVVDDARMNQAGRPDHDVGRSDSGRAAQGDQVRCTGPGANEGHLPGACQAGGHGALRS